MARLLLLCDKWARWGDKDDLALRKPSKHIQNDNSRDKRLSQTGGECHEHIVKESLFYNVQLICAERLISRVYPSFGLFNIQSQFHGARLVLVDRVYVVVRLHVANRPLDNTIALLQKYAMVP